MRKIIIVFFILQLAAFTQITFVELPFFKNVKKIEKGESPFEYRLSRVMRGKLDNTQTEILRKKFEADAQAAELLKKEMETKSRKGQKVNRTEYNKLLIKLSLYKKIDKKLELIVEKKTQMIKLSYIKNKKSKEYQLTHYRDIVELSNHFAALYKDLKSRL